MALFDLFKNINTSFVIIIIHPHISNNHIKGLTQPFFGFFQCANRFNIAVSELFFKPCPRFVQDIRFVVHHKDTNI